MKNTSLLRVKMRLETATPVSSTSTHLRFAPLGDNVSDNSPQRGSDVPIGTMEIATDHYSDFSKELQVGQEYFLGIVPVTAAAEPTATPPRKPAAKKTSAKKTSAKKTSGRKSR